MYCSNNGSGLETKKERRKEIWGGAIEKIEYEPLLSKLNVNFLRYVGWLCNRMTLLGKGLAKMFKMGAF